MSEQHKDSEMDQAIERLIGVTAEHVGSIGGMEVMRCVFCKGMYDREDDEAHTHNCALKEFDRAHARWRAATFGDPMESLKEMAKRLAARRER